MAALTVASMADWRVEKRAALMVELSVELEEKELVASLAAKTDE